MTRICGQLIGEDIHKHGSISDFDTGVHASAIGREVDITIGGLRGEALALYAVNPVFELADLSSELAGVGADALRTPPAKQSTSIRSHTSRRR